MMGLLPNMSANLYLSLLLEYEPSTFFFLDPVSCSIGQAGLELIYFFLDVFIYMSRL